MTLAELDEFMLEAQSELDDLWAKRLIPFKLIAGKVESSGTETYIVYFYDNRFYSVDFYRKNHQPFRVAIRTAVLAQTAKVNGRLKK